MDRQVLFLWSKFELSNWLNEQKNLGLEIEACVTLLILTQFFIIAIWGLNRPDDLWNIICFSNCWKSSIIFDMFEWLKVKETHLSYSCKVILCCQRDLLGSSILWRVVKCIQWVELLPLGMAFFLIRIESCGIPSCLGQDWDIFCSKKIKRRERGIFLSHLYNQDGTGIDKSCPVPSHPISFLILLVWFIIILLNYYIF